MLNDRRNALLFSVVQPIEKQRLQLKIPASELKTLHNQITRQNASIVALWLKGFKRRCFFFRIFLVNSWRCWIISTTTFFVFFDHLFFTEYQCFYVTCEYTGWSEWSSSCGNGMKRVRRLSKQTERIKEQQGGCSGLTTTCEKEQLETKNTQCE